MLRIIFKQLLNRWKKNIWLALELLLVFCLVWYMVDYFFVLAYNKNLSSYRDTHNTYMLDIGTFSEKNPGYDTDAAEPAVALANFRRIIDRLKEYPEIESVAIAQHSSFPELGSFSGSEYRNPEDTTRIASVQHCTFAPEGDYLKVFRHTADRGRKQVFLTDYDWGEPSHVLITRMMAEVLFSGEPATGKIIESTYKHPDHPRKQLRVAGVIDDVKRFDYLRPYSVIFIPERLTESNYLSMMIGFRIKGNIPAADFIPAFKKEMGGPLQVGNFYLRDIRYFPKIEQETNAYMTNEIRVRTAIMSFFSLCVFLCVLGTFWYRVNMRREEVGIRRAMGADTYAIRKLFLLEGLLLLSLIVLPAMLIEMQFVYAGLIDTLGQGSRSYGDYLPDHTAVRFLITNGITWLLMSAIITLAIWYPAHSASRVKPVDALRDE